jgi:anaphase-promoting complex subunit 11
MKIKIKRILAVAEWRWGIDEDVCGICRSAFEACCPGVKYPGDDCPPVFGACGHAFHMQCVMKWLESQQNVKQECPLCRQVLLTLRFINLH